MFPKRTWAFRIPSSQSQIKPEAEAVFDPSSINDIRFGAAKAAHSIIIIRINAAGNINFFINKHILS